MDSAYGSAQMYALVKYCTNQIYKLILAMYFNFPNPFIFARCKYIFVLQTLNSVRSHSSNLKYQRCTPTGVQYKEEAFKFLKPS